MGYKCKVCGAEFPEGSEAIEHIIDQHQELIMAHLEPLDAGD